MTMPSTLDYSAVMAIHTLWLAARTYGIGLGWVSILNPPDVERILEVPAGWALIAYLCLGYPVEEQALPELERRGWERRPHTWVLSLSPCKTLSHPFKMAA